MLTVQFISYEHYLLNHKHFSELAAGSTGSDKINLESSLLIKSALIESRKLLMKNKKFLIVLANELLTKETLDADQLDKLLLKHIKIKNNGNSKN